MVKTPIAASTFMKNNEYVVYFGNSKNFLQYNINGSYSVTNAPADMVWAILSSTDSQNCGL